MTPGLISVVMPAYNAAAHVAEAVGSVLGQTYANTELIVVDDGSADDTEKILRRFAHDNPERMHLAFTSRAGPNLARNVGLHHARGEYVAFLDADDWWREDCLDALVTALIDREADLAYCGWQNVGALARNTEAYVPPAYETQDTVACFLNGCPWPIHAALVRRRIIDEIGGFSEHSPAAEDYDLWLRVLGHTRRIVRVPEVLAFYRWHGNSQQSSRKARQVYGAVQARKRFVNDFPELVRHLSAEQLHHLVDRQYLREAYRAYWRRDLPTAQALFRLALAQRAWKPQDLRYLLPALLPAAIFRRLVDFVDRMRD